MSAGLNLVSQTINKPEPPKLSYVHCGEITAVSGSDHQWQVDNSYSALSGTGLMLTPCVGDKVSFIESKGQYYILQVLYRPDAEKPLSFETERDIDWQAPNVRFTVFDEMEFVSLNRISLMCKHGVMSMTNTLVTQAEHYIQKAAQLSITAKTLLRLNAKHQIITADEDVRIDGKRINMG